VYNSTHS